MARQTGLVCALSLLLPSALALEAEGIKSTALERANQDPPPVTELARTARYLVHMAGKDLKWQVSQFSFKY